MMRNHHKPSSLVYQLDHPRYSDTIPFLARLHGKCFVKSLYKFHGSLGCRNATILPTAAIVLEFGVLVQSPKPKIFGYRICLNVLGSTQRNPASLVNSGCFFNTVGGPIGGVTWSREYCNNENN